MKSTSTLSQLKGNQSFGHGLKLCFKIIMLVVLMTSLLATVVKAQIDYNVSKLTGQTYAPLSGGGITTINTVAQLQAGWGSTNADDGGVVVTLPFTFNYNGIGITQVSFNSNGFLAMGDQTATILLANMQTGGNLFTATAPNNTIAPWWKNGGANFPVGPGSMRHGLISPDVYAFQWDKNVGTGTADGATVLISYQVNLYLTPNVNSGRIEFIYGGATGTIATGASVGIENVTGGPNHYINAMSNSGLFNFNGGAINSTTTSAAWPGYGNGYQFNPVGVCAGPVTQPTTLNLTPISATQIDGSFTAASGLPNSYLVVRYNAVPAPVITNPTNGTSYAVGAALGTGTVVVSGAATSFSATGLTANTQYTFRIYAMCGATSPTYNVAATILAGTATTLNNAPPTCPGVFYPGSVTGESGTVVSGLILTWAGAIGVPAISAYDVYLSTNSALVTASDPSVLVSPNQAATTFTPFPLLSTGTTYFWKVVAKNAFGQSSGCVVNSFTTITPNTITSNGVGGLWGSNATWVGNVVPAPSDNVIIADGATVVVDRILSVNNLTVGQGTSGILHWGATSFALTINGNLNISNGAQFNAFNTAGTGQTINLLGDLNNAGLASLAHPTTVLNMNGMKAGGQNINQSGSGIYMGTTGIVGTNKGIIRALNFCNVASSFPLVPITAPVLNINTPIVVNGNPGLLGGTINTGGNLSIDNTAQVFGQSFLDRVFEVVITGMGAGYTSAPAVVIAAPTGVGVQATGVANFDPATGTVRSITITNPGSGYRSSPTVTLTGGGFTTAATAIAVVVQSVAGSASTNNQINGDYVTISGGFSSINNTHGVGGVTTTNGGLGYTSAPAVGFSFPTSSINLLTNGGGSGYTSTPTVTLSGNTFLTGGTNPTFSVVVANGKVVSVYCTGGGTLWNSYPTLTLTGGGFVTPATIAFPTTPGTGCLATANAVVTNEQVSGFTVTNAGFGYVTPPTVGLVGGGFATAAAAPTARVGLYGITYGFFQPALTALKRTEGAEIPANRIINNLIVNNAVQGVDFTGNLEIDANPTFFTPLTLTSGAARMGGNTLFFSNNTYAGLTPAATNFVNGTVRIASPGGSVTKTFPVLQRGVVINTGTGSGSTGSTITSLTVSAAAAPTGVTTPAGGVATGSRSYRVQTNGGVYGINPTAQLNFGAEDALAGDNPGLFLAQAASVSGPWTVRSAAAAAGLIPATGNRVSATVAPGPFVSNAGDDYFAFTTSTLIPPPLNYSVARTTGNTYTSIIPSGLILPFAASASNDDATTAAVTIPFSTFTYQGEPVTSFNVCTNGWMKLNSASSPATALTAFSNQLGLNANANFIAPFWDDLTTFPNAGDAANTNLNASTRYQIIGSTPGSRQIVVEWKNYTVQSVAGLKISFQVVLDETDNSIKFNYGPFESFNGNNNFRYSYSTGLVGRFVSTNPLSGQVFAQQYENSDAFGFGFCSTANVGANGLMIKPQCNSSIKFTPGTYAGLVVPASTAPANDNVAGAITIPVTNTIPTDLCSSYFTSRFATASPQSVCAGTADDDVWFNFVVPPATSAVTLRIIGSGGYVPRLQVYSDAGITPLPGTNCVVGLGGPAGTGAGTLTNVSLTGLTATQTYWVRVYHDGGGVVPTVQVNAANSLSTTSITNFGSGYQLSSTGNVTSARVRITGGGGTDGVATANFTSGTLSSITINNAGYGYTSNPTLTIEKPDWGLTGEFELFAFTTAPNDECITATELTNVSNTSCVDAQNSRNGVSTGNATASAEAVVCLSSVADDDLWYKFTATSNTSYITVGGNGSFRPAVQVYDGGVGPLGDCATKISLTCQSAAASGGTVSIAQATVIGNVYFVRVYDFLTGSGGAGTFYICVVSAVPACASAPVTPANAGFACLSAATTTLSWPAVATATGYDVFFDAGAGPAVTQVATNQVGTSFAAGILAAGSYSWRVIPRNANGPATSCSDFTFTVVALPVASVTPPTGSVCSGDASTVTLTASGGTAFDWLPAAGLNTVAGATVIAKPAATTTYTVNVTGTGGCSATATAVVTVNITTVFTVSPATATICSGGSATVTINQTVPLPPIGSPLTSGIPAPYCTATYTSGTGFGDWINSMSILTTTLNNTTGATPTPFYSNYPASGTTTATLTAGTLYTMQVQGGTFGTCLIRGWIDYNNDGVFSDAETIGVSPNVGASAIGTFTFTVPLTAYNGATRMRIRSSDTSPGPATSQACGATNSGFGETEDYIVTLTGASALPTYSYAWSPATGVSSTTISNPVISAPIGTTVYTVTVTSSNGCSSTGTTAITNLGFGDAPPTTTSTAICAGQTGTLSASGTSTLNWYSAASGGILVNTGPTFVSAFPATTTYYVESFNGICPSQRTPVTITVNANPSTSPTVLPTSVCLGSTAQLDAGTFLSGTLATPLNQNNGSSATGFDITNTSASPVTLHFFQFQSSSTAGTVGVQQIWMSTTPMNCVIPANVTTAPGWVLVGSASTTSAGTSPILTTVPLDVNITIPAGATYAFAIGGALGQSYTGVGGSNGCPIIGSTPHLNVKEGFGGTLTGTIAGRAWNGTVTYQYGDPNLNFAWSPAGDLNSSTIKSPVATPTTAGPNPYTVTVTNLAGCTSTATVTLSVVAIPAAPTAAVSGALPCGNGNVVLTASGAGGTFKWYANASGGSALPPNGSPRTFVVGSDTAFYVSETTIAAPGCEGPRTPVFVNIVEPDTIAATVDIPVICNQGSGAIQVALSVANVSNPQLNQYQYTWTAPGTGGLNSSTGTAVTANPTATTIYTVTANQIGNLTVNINGLSPNGPTNQDEITWTLKDASNVTILSGGPYAGFSNNVTSLPVLSNNGPFTFQITAGNAIDTNFANFTVFCETNVIASGCVKGALNLSETACTNIGTLTVPGLAGCLGSCNRIATVRVGVGTTPVINSLTTFSSAVCAGDSSQFTLNAVQGGVAAPAAEFGTYCAPVTYTSPGLTSDFIANVSFNTLNNPSGDGPGDYNYFPPVGAATTTVAKGTTYTMTITPTTAFSQGTAVFIDWNNNGLFSDAGELVFTGASGTVPVSQSVTVPLTAATANVRMRVVDVFVGVPDATWACSPTTFGFGEVEDYTITVGGASSVGLLYAWSPAAGLSATNIANPKAAPAATTTYTVTVSDEGGCTISNTITLNVNPTPSAPAVSGASICGPGVVNLSATLGTPGNTIIWTDTIGGQIVNSGTSYGPYALTSGSYYVHEVGASPAPSNIGYAGGAPVGFFPDVASFMNFTVANSEGIVINTVQVSTNLGAGSYPLVIALVNPAGQIVSVHDTIFITGGSTALQTITLDMYVPQGSWRLQPISNPNLSVDQGGGVTASLPWTIPGQMTINCFGNASSSCFGTNTFGLFYNWNVTTACYSLASIVNYTVNPSPAFSIQSTNGLSFCDSVSTILNFIDSTGVYDTFEWSPAGGLSATTGNSVNVSTLTSATYTVTANDIQSGCNAVGTITLTVNPAPTVITSFTDTTVCTNQPTIVFNSTAAKSGLAQIGTRIDPNFVNGQVYGGNTTQFSQMIFTPAELNAAGIVGPTNITSLAFYVAGKLTTTTYNVNIAMRSDAGIPSSWPNTNHINTGLTTVYTNPAIASTLGWNTYNLTPFFWDGVSNLLVSECFTHNIPGFFDVVSTSNAGAVRFNALNAAACGAATGALAAINPNDRPNVRFTGGNVLFSWAPATGLSSATDEDPVLTVSALTPNTTTQYILTVTDPVSGCQAKDTINVTVLDVPSAPTASNVTRCGFGDVTLNATALGGFTLRWYDAASGGNLIGTGSPLVYELGASTTVYVEEFNGGCAGPRTAVTITIDPAPAVDGAGLNVPICDGNGPATLTASSLNAGYSYSWSPNDGSLNATTGAVVLANPAVSTTYTVLGVDVNGCQDTAVIVVNVGTSPAIASVTVSPATVCVGTPATITASIPSAVAGYSATSIAFAPVSPTGTPTVLQNGGVAVQPLATGSLDDGIWTVPLPAGFAFNYYGVSQTTLDVSTNGFIGLGGLGGLNGCCSGQILPDATTPNNVVAMAWEDWNQTAGTMDVFTNGVAPFRKFVIRAQGVPRFGGTGAPTTAMIVLNETLNTIEMHLTSVTAGATDNTTQGIENSTGTSATVVPGRNSTVWSATNEGWLFELNTPLNISWSPATGLSSTTTTTTAVNTTLTGPGTFVYTVTATNPASGCSSTSSVTLTVLDIPTAPVVIGPLTNCGPAILTLTSDGPDDVNWFDAATGGTLLGTGQTFSPLVLATTTYYAERSNGTCTNAGGRTPWTITITTPASLAASAGSATICENSSTTLSVDAGTVGNYTTYTWQPATGLSATTGSSVSASPIVTTTYTVFGTNPPTGNPTCSNIATVTVTVNPAPVITSVTASPLPVCDGGTVTLAATVLGAGGPGNMTVGPVPFAPVSPTGPVTDAGTGDDAILGPFPIGFTFPFFGVNQTQIYIGCNGFVTFNNASASGCCSGGVIPTPGNNPNDLIALAWNDLNVTAAGQLTYYNLTSPNRFVIQYTNVIQFAGGGAPLTGQIVIYESGQIDINTNSVTSDGSNQTQGVMNAAGTFGTASPGFNSTPFTASNTAFSFLPPVSVSYAWTPAAGLSSSTISNPTATVNGNTVYTVTVANSGTGCTISSTVAVNPTALPKPILTPGDTILCSNDLAFDMTVVDTGAYAGGYPPGTTFDFLGAGAVLYQSSTSNVFLNQQQSDAFYVVVTLPNYLGGCVATSDTSVVDFGSTQAPQYSLATDSVGCFGASTGNAIASITFGGTPNFRYQWYTSGFGTLLSDVTTSATSDTLTGQPTGWYIVVITDHQGFPTSPYCSVVDSIFLGEPQGPIEVFEEVNGHVDVQCYGYATGAIDVTASGGTGALSYLWSNGSTDEDQTGLVAGIYTVTVSDQRGCFYEFVTEIVENPQVTVGTDQSNVSCNTGADGSATVYVNGGIGGYTYLWSNGTTDQTAFDLAAGTYTVIITDNSGVPGCDTIITFLITEPTLLDATSSVNNLNCNGASNGVATVYPIGGNPPYNYSWNSIPAQTTATAVNLTAGTYTCLITDSTGCAKDVVVQISEPDSIIVDQLLDNPSCFGSNDGNAIITVSGGTPGYSYLWSNGETTNTATGLSAGTYIVTVTDANGCQVISTVLMVEPSQILTTIGCLTNVACNGQATGTACVMPTGGTPGYTYLWNTVPAQTTSSASGLAAGTYTAMVTDANGCTASVDVTITQPDAIALNAAVEDPLCNGGVGSVELSISGGALPYSVLWSNGATTEINGGLLAGSYSVTVTDANGCVVSQSFVITNPSAISASAAVSNVTCNGGVNGSITINVSGGAGGYTYQWSNGEITSTIVGLVAGNYTVTITDLNSCSITQTVVVSQPAELSCICNANVTNVSCFGLANGSITALPVGGTAPYSYSWIRISPSISGVLATTQTISGLTAGTYQVTITDANGCVKVGNATVTEPTQLVAFGIVNGNICAGSSTGSITVNTYGGVPPYSYAWSTIPVQTSSTATGLGAGSYSCIVTDANGCSVIVNNTISTPNAIVLSTSSTNAKCFGSKNGTASVTATGGVAPFTYLWSNGKTTSLAIGLAAGTYTVTVTDSYGCTAVASVVVGQPSKLAALYITTNPLCFGSANGTINLTITGGSTPYTYLWSNGSTNEDQTGLLAGLYTVLVKDKNGCVINAAVTLTQPNVIALSTTVKNLKCFGATNGKITVNVIGGTAPYAYVWSTGSTIVSSNNLAVGTYTVTVTDSKGCSSSISSTVTQPAQIVCNATVVNNVSCFGGTNGKISVSVSGGLAPYTYLWNTNPIATTKIVNNVPAGTYSVTVKDKNGCTSVCTVTVTQPLAPVSATVSGTNVNCFGGNNGTAGVVANGGTAPYTYLWNTGVASTSDNVSGLTAGIYTVIVTDANGCTGTGSVTITQNPAITLTETHTNASCGNNSFGSITAVAVGGLSPYTYTLNPGPISNGTGSFTGLAAGIYDVTVSDEAGCSATINGIVILQPAPLVMGAVSSTDVACFGGNNGTATAGAVSGGVAPYTYSWNTVPPQATSTAIGLTAGTYTVTVTDAGGCTVSDIAVINEPATPVTIQIVNQTNISCNGGLTGSAEVLANGGNGPYSYLWSDGQTTTIATGLTAGAYQVTATDANGCVATTSVVITQPNQFIVTASFTNVLCNGNSDGTVTASVSGGNAPFSYTLNPGNLSSGTGLFTGLGAGIYTVEATDGGGCTASVIVTITEPGVLIANTNSTDVSCNAGSNGTATVYATGGTVPYAYAWTGGSSLQNPTGLVAGTYTVTVTDANNCSLERTVTISEPAAMSIAQSQTNVLCNGLTTGTATATVTGGSAPYFYFWSNGQLTATATGLGSTIYTVTVSDYKGCSVTATYDITENTSLLVDTNVTNPTCFGGLGTAEVIVVGGTPGYTYLWSNGATTSTVSVTAGTYYVTITDANGCNVSQCVVVTEPSQVTCAANVTDVTCDGLNNGTATAVGSGGTGIYTYLWSDAQTTATATGLTNTNYSVIVTDENGCSSECFVIVGQPAPISLGLSTSNATCGTANGSASATVSGGTAPYSYLWSTTETSQSVSNLAPGTYTVTVTDANGCGPVSASVTIGTNVPVSCTTTQVNPTCSGYSNGSATVIPAGGNGSYSVLWNTAPVQNTLTATGLAAGTYEVTVTDISGCSSVCIVEITEPSPLVLSATQTNSACNGGNSGIAIVTANGGTPYSVGSAYTYLWTNGQTNATATGLASGTYYVTVKDSVGCEATLCVIMQQPISMTCNTSTTPTVCGQAIGSAVVNVFGGSAPYSYNWSTVPAQTNAIATLLAAGTYTVVVTDANGCTSQCTATVIQPGAVSFSLGVVNASCNGGNGTLSVNGLNGGTAPYTYLWSNSSTASSINAVAGSYTVTVTDANGCSMFANGTISEPALLVANSSSTDVSCNGNTNGSACIAVSGGTQPYSYSWNTGASSICINNLVAGTYTATVTDSKGCTQSIVVTITQPNILDTLSSAATVASCGLNNGTGTITPIGGTAPYTYAWNTSPVQTTQTATGLAGGNNFVTVTDAKGCAITVCIKVPTSNGIGLALSSPTYAGGVNIRCNGGSDGSVNLTVSGTGPYVYTWSNGATTEDIIGLTAGVYSVTVSNGGCTSTASITLTQGSAIVLSTTQVNVTCQGGITGSASVNVVGGTAPYNYSWSTVPVQTNKTATGLSAGTYTVTVGDANGCTQTVSVTLTQPATGMNITASSVNPNCNGASNGTIDITVVGGTMPYTYLWTDGAIVEDRTGMNAGSHTVTVTDASGCTIQLCVVLTQPTQISLTTSKTDVSCAGGNSGSANVAAAGGTPPYTYLWNNGATTAAISGLYAGTFTVTVTDFNGCIRYGNVVINASAPMTLATQSTNVTVYGGNNGTASVTVMSGGTAPYSYSWNTIPVKTTASVSGLTAGTYQVTVVDNKGCVKTASVVITQPNYICSTGTPFRTETPSRWGAATGTAATYLTANFSAAFPGGLVVGGGCVGSKTLSLTNATAVRNYEVNQSTSGSGTVLSANLVNPASSAFQSALAANCVALTLNVTFDAYDPNFAPLPTVNLGSLIYTAAPFAGFTVNQILSEGNRKLGGCSSPYTISQLNVAMQNIDSAYKAGVTGPTASLLSCPAPPRLASSASVGTENDVTVYPNPSVGVLNVKFEATENGNIVINMMDMTGRSVWNVQEPVFVGENIRTYDFGELPKGIYLMQVIKEGKSEIIKVVLR